MRTLVISDIHGYPALIDNALSHAGFLEGVDRFIFAGDFLDGGPGAQEAFDLIDERADVILLGNHEIAAMFGMPIWPQDPLSKEFAGIVTERILAFDGRWKLACAEQGVLITHAGVSAVFQPRLAEVGDAAAGLAAALSSDLRVLLARLGVGNFSEDEIEPLLGMDGPLWWRPLMPGNAAPLVGLTQACGHTPRELYTGEGLRALGVLGIHLVAPSTGWDEERIARSYRYGVIEDGEVWVESGEL